MDLLETVLRSCGAEKHFKSFKDNGIDYSVLKTLTEEDLKEIGVEEEDIRSKILSFSKNLRMRSEKGVLKVNGPYLTLLLMQTNIQLVKHYVNLLYAVNGPKVDLCYIKLKESAECLASCVESYDKQVEALVNLKELRERRKRTKIDVIKGRVIVAALIMVSTYIQFISPYSLLS